MIETLNTAEIAALLRVKRDTVTERIVRRPDFPKPWVYLSRTHRLWRLSDVMGWIDQRREAMSSELVR